jgi:hypothetical protein
VFLFILGALIGSGICVVRRFRASAAVQPMQD